MIHHEGTKSNAAQQALLRLGAVSFQHRFGSSLNQHAHPHTCVTDGVFKRAGNGGGVTFHAVRPLSAADLANHPLRQAVTPLAIGNIGKHWEAETAECAGADPKDFDASGFLHLGEPPEPPHVSPAQGPPVDWGDLVPTWCSRLVIGSLSMHHLMTCP